MSRVAIATGPRGHQIIYGWDLPEFHPSDVELSITIREKWRDWASKFNPGYLGSPVITFVDVPEMEAKP